MAISATINKVILNIADMDRHYYATHELTVAQHPSETNVRFMLRLIAFALNAHEHLSFTKGLCADNEPDIWQKSLSDEVELWIDLGQLDEKRIRKACGRSRKVIIYTYDTRKADVWWAQQADNLQRYKNLDVVHIHAEGVDALIQRNLELQCNIQEGEMHLSSAKGDLIITLDNKKD